MSAECAGEHFVDAGFYKGRGPVSVRWVAIDAVAKRCSVRVFDDEDAYVAYTLFHGQNICCSHRDPAEASLEVLKQMARTQIGDKADF